MGDTSDRRGRRVRLAAVAAACGSAAALLYLWRWAAMSAAEIHGADFLTFRDTAVILRQYGMARVYDLPTHAAMHLASGGQPVVGIEFVYPPVAALFIAPLAWMSVTTGYFVWSGLQLLAMVASALVALAARGARLGRLLPLAVVLMTFTSPAVYADVIQGQWIGFDALALAVTYLLWHRDRPAWGAVVLTATIAATRPQLGVGLAAWMLGWGNRRAIAGAVTAVLAVVAADLIVAGPRGFQDWLAATAHLEQAESWTSHYGVSSALASWIPGWAGLAAAGVASVALLVLAGWLGYSWRSHRLTLEVALAAGAAVALSLSPHLLLHDLAFLVPAGVAVCVRAAEEGRPRFLIQCVIAWLAVELAGGLDSIGGPTLVGGHLSGLALAAVAVVAVTYGAGDGAGAGRRRRPAPAGATG